jgi:hypothetical protein
MIDVFLFCDLDATHISARGEVAGDEVLPLLRVIDLLPVECTAIIDLREVMSFDDAADSMLRISIEARSVDRIAFRVLRAEPELDAA